MPLSFDLVCAGRACVDIYAEQDGARLEDVETFRMYLGGSAANICVGAARLGLKSAMLTGVGDEAFGRFVCRALQQEGIDISMVRRNPHRLTALVALAIRQTADFPRIFYYTNSADFALGVEDVDWTLVERSRGVLITGSYLIQPRLRQMTHRLAEYTRSRSIRLILDIDFRPVLWGLVPIGAANAMTARSDRVTAAYKEVLPLCDLIVGTADEILIAGGEERLDESVSAIRQLSAATVVVKRGHKGCSIYPATTTDDPIDVAGFPVQVVNSVGAGDAFLSGFVAGWLRGKSLNDSARLGNACGALVVTRHGCTPAMPSMEEAEYFLSNHEQLRVPSTDPVLKSLHRATTHRSKRNQAFVLAFDHRWQLEELASHTDGVDRLPRLKTLIYEGFLAAASDRSDVGVLVDETYGGSILERASGSGIWIGRALDVPRSFPLRLGVESDLAGVLRVWPADHIVKVLCYAHPSDPPPIMDAQLAELGRLQEACDIADRQYLVELQPSPGRTYRTGELPQLMDRIYVEGIRPDWWKLPPDGSSDAWIAAGDVIRTRDRQCHGMLVLGKTAAPHELEEAFRACAREPLCVGFAVGRGIFLAAAEHWLAGRWDDAQVMDAVRERFNWFVMAWETAHGQAKGG